VTKLEAELAEEREARRRLERDVAKLAARVESLERAAVFSAAPSTAI
jgi:hypothetical protein